MTKTLVERLRAKRTILRLEAASRIEELERDNTRLRSMMASRENLKASLGLDMDAIAVDVARDAFQKLEGAEAEIARLRHALSDKG